jgi:poly(A) polymerase
VGETYVYLPFNSVATDNFIGRAIYGAVYGYPGGVAWAIMVARICQLYPFACGATILSKFFNLMMKWHWPRPVMLKHIEEGSMGLKVWNPQVSALPFVT